MAKYWLGVCYLKGYGIAQNTTLANAYLNTHFETKTAAERTDANGETTTESILQSEEQITEMAFTDQAAPLPRDCIVWSMKDLITNQRHCRTA
jgi:TPR repeat protein